ncbi:hypothetical protein COOONC_14783 [Cooperia oncophora]
MRNGYHGMTQAVIGATNIGTWKQPMPSGFGVLKAMAADPYSGPWGGKKCRDSPIQTKRDCSCKDGECMATDKYGNIGVDFRLFPLITLIRDISLWQSTKWR